ncbi:MAG: phosphoribosylglycinamide formyltransferase [Gemmatimonadetes bacterium]|nr:phosphoribosylglycinamide formyltransferase [Gemmatimonadota bacterium]
MKPYRVAVLASGGGTNLQALLDVCRDGAPARVVLVLSNNPKAGALARAREAGVPAQALPDPADALALVRSLRSHEADLVVLAGYLKLVPREAVEAFSGRIINIHPALLPAFAGTGMYGRRVHQAVIASGATVSGATVHVVTPEYDRGPIVAQWPVPVAPGDTPESLAERVLAVEHQLLPAVVLAAARAGRVVRLVPRPSSFGTGGGKVELETEGETGSGR